MLFIVTFYCIMRAIVGLGLGSSLVAINAAIWVQMWLFHASGGCYLRLFWPCGYLGWLLDLLRLFWRLFELLWVAVEEMRLFRAIWGGCCSFCGWLLMKCGCLGCYLSYTILILQVGSVQHTCIHRVHCLSSLKIQTVPGHHHALSH